MIPKVINKAMEITPIRIEVMQFLQSTGISARRLAREAGVNASSVLHLSCGGRKDVASSTADKLRAAMARLSQEAEEPALGRSSHASQ